MIGTLRRECLDNTIVFNERQLARVLQEYLDSWGCHPSFGHTFEMLKFVEGKLHDLI